MSNHDSPTVGNGQTRKGAPPNRLKQKLPLHQIYALPVPVKTFPLPAFYPNNPLSIFHVAYVWLSQVLRPPLAEPSVVHKGVWSDATTSVHVTDARSIRALWEQGFYGKGNLSRSEPNWLKREQVRRGLGKAHVSELLTIERREERARAKWERARLEQEAIRQTRLDEAGGQEAKAALSPPPPPQSRQPEVGKKIQGPPVSPLQLLALPNSSAVALAWSEDTRTVESVPAADLVPSHEGLQSNDARACAPVGPLELLALPNSLADVSLGSALSTYGSASVPAVHQTSQDAHFDQKGSVSSAQSFQDELSSRRSDNLSSEKGDSSASFSLPTGEDSSTPLVGIAGPSRDTVTRRKSVRFSAPTGSIDSELDVPQAQSDSKIMSSLSNNKETVAGSGSCHGKEDLAPRIGDVNGDISVNHVEDKEHLQLMPEEAFFLRFGLGVLEVSDPWSGLSMSNTDLLRLLRQSSYFPPLRQGFDAPELRPDDAFLINYVVYHHFRSLGWVPRAGIKFGVDWLLYAKGPVFDHAEFGLMIIPSYAHPSWAGSTQQSQRKTWAWFHSVLRVLSHVMKSLVLVYVDVPPAQVFDAKMEEGLVQVLESYRIREVVVKRWSSNRNR